MDLSRRKVLCGAAAASAAAALTSLASSASQAAAPPVGKQAPGWYRYKLGNYEITVVTDGVNRIPKFPDSFVTNKSRDEVNAGIASLGWGLPKDQVAIPYSPIVVNTGAKLVVIDTGTGEANFERSKGAAGQFHSNLKASGIEPSQVDIVIISHFHPDHINGLLTKDNKPAFANAEILVPAAEWKYFMDDAEMNKQTSDRMKGVFGNLRRVFDALGRKVTPYEPGKEIAPGITSVATYGHTPGHNSHIVASGNSKVYVQGDVTNIPLFVRNPGWHLMFDQIPDMAEATRRKVYDMLVAEKMLVQGFHYPFPGLAYVEKTSTGYRESMVPWNPII
ncbi:MAG TPA: MBL fold metallo-hydrolase [Xanthobacteraceae bacterium]|nr:MBL fold metallo-hydrolase [Xanthobacteraceae bacterium]